MRCNSNTRYVEEHMRGKTHTCNVLGVFDLAFLK